MPKLAHYFIMLVSDLSGEPVRGRVIQVPIRLPERVVEFLPARLQASMIQLAHVVIRMHTSLATAAVEPHHVVAKYEAGLEAEAQLEAEEAAEDEEESDEEDEQ